MKLARGFSIYLIIFAFIVLIIVALRMANPIVSEEPYSRSDLMNDLEAGRVAKIVLQGDADTVNSGVAKVTLKQEQGTVVGKVAVKTVPILDLDGFSRKLDEIRLIHPDLDVDDELPPKTNIFLSLLTPFIFLIVAVVIMVFLIRQMQGGGGGRAMSFGKSKAKVAINEKNKITFAHVAGLEEEKAELAEIVDFLKAPRKYVEIGARIPKGVLLVGPPGTGKTYLAKAVSGEAGVPFFSISGSDFVEMFVGVGASRVRDLFENAKKNSPCIIFIDEIDAVGRRRGAGLGGGHDEREQTLNQLLVEMDGFSANEGVIVMAATNRHDILDPALLRPGRFDRRVSVSLPDVKGREGVLRVHAKGKKIAQDVDFNIISQTTAGFTPADLENMMNEAALLAARENKKDVDMNDIRQAFIKVGIGTEKKSRVVSDRDKRITAYHEAGHAIIQEAMSELEPVHIVSIIPTGWAAGYLMPMSSDDNRHMTKTRMLHDIVCLLAGRTAEELVIKEISAGASNDIERATKIARSMVTKYGMSEVLGPVQFGDDNDEVFIGRDLAHARNYSEEIASVIDSETRKIIDEARKKAVETLQNFDYIMHACVELLMKKEKITGDEFRALFGDALPVKTNPRKKDYMKLDEMKDKEELREAVKEDAEPVDAASEDKEDIGNV